MNISRPSRPVVRPQHRAPAARGSVLITALIFSAIIAISLTTYIQIALTAAKLANRSFYQNAALNLAEYGLERALACYNRLDDVATPAAAWTDAGWPNPETDNSIKRTFSDFPLGPGVTGEVTVYCRHYNPGTGVTPVIVSRARVSFSDNTAGFSKYMEVTLRKRSLFANGMVARDSITWKGGNALADSWNSDDDNNPATPAVAYDSATGPAQANATVGTPNATDNALDFGGGTIRGRVMNAGGTIAKTGVAVLSNTTSGTGWDTSLITTDFSATFPPVEVPNPPVLEKNLVTTSDPITIGSTLPRKGDVNWNGVYYYDFGAGWNFKSTGGSGKVSDNLTVNGPVVFLATVHSKTNVIDLSGKAGIVVAANGNLKIYTDGNIEASGNGMINSNHSPATMQIFGTNPTVGVQQIRFVGKASSTGTIYAPNGTVELNGNGSLNGAVVANTVKLVGNAAFHYDEALGNMTSGNPFRVAKWRELQSADERKEYATQLGP
jgi:hypothetical protein